MNGMVSTNASVSDVTLFPVGPACPAQARRWYAALTSTRSFRKPLHQEWLRYQAPMVMFNVSLKELRRSKSRMPVIRAIHSPVGRHHLHHSPCRRPATAPRDGTALSRMIAATNTGSSPWRRAAATMLWPIAL